MLKRLMATNFYIIISSKGSYIRISFSWNHLRDGYDAKWNLKDFLIRSSNQLQYGYEFSYIL